MVLLLCPNLTNTSSTEYQLPLAAFLQSFTWAPPGSKGSRMEHRYWSCERSLEGISWALRGLRGQYTFPVEKHWCFGAWRQAWGRCPLRIYWEVSGGIEDLHCGLRHSEQQWDPSVLPVRIQHKRCIAFHSVPHARQMVTALAFLQRVQKLLASVWFGSVLLELVQNKIKWDAHLQKHSFWFKCTELTWALWHPWEDTECPEGWVLSSNTLSFSLCISLLLCRFTLMKAIISAIQH